MTTSKKTNRDPNAPKRNLSAYLLYQNAMREQFKSTSPGVTFGQLAKYTSAMYAQLSPADKEAWAARASADKARYLQELSTYVPPPGYDAKGDQIVVPMNIARGPMPSMMPLAKGHKGMKDPSAPKRNLYLVYQNAMRDQFKRENPGMTFGQLAKYTSHMYKNLTPAEKAWWEARLQQENARAMAGYPHNALPPPGRGRKLPVGAAGMMHHQPVVAQRKRSKRTPKDPSAPKRSSGAYVFFTNEMRPRILHEYPGIKFIELGKVMGERWRALTPAQKKRYEDISANDKARFRMEMKQYNAALNNDNAAAAGVANVPHQHQQQQQQRYAPQPQVGQYYGAGAGY